ncbi:MAG: inositol monophosphatase [Myxococcales bacterium]|nr:inositol monophosphatase [Myxococcales bacterium]MCB9644106.1 inositol monophosphatase [Myxococcales bacterium]
MVQEWMDFACHLAKGSGTLLMKSMDSMRTIDRKSTQSDLVTDADRASEAWLVKEIRQRYPEHRILGEEGTGDINDLHKDGMLWVIDPLDGTVNYAHQLPIFAVSIALLRDGVPVVGVVYLPVLDELFCSGQGKGTTRNGVEVHVSSCEALGEAVVATGFAYDKHLSERDNIENAARMIKKVRGIRRMGAAAVDLAYVACGRLDGYWEEKLQPWDMAAGWLLVKEAGGKITGYDGCPCVFSEGHVIASGQALHASMLAVIQPYAEKYGIGSPSAT